MFIYKELLYVNIHYSPSSQPVISLWWGGGAPSFLPLIPPLGSNVCDKSILVVLTWMEYPMIYILQYVKPRIEKISRSEFVSGSHKIQGNRRIWDTGAYISWVCRVVVSLLGIIWFLRSISWWLQIALSEFWYWERDLDIIKYCSTGTRDQGLGTMEQGLGTRDYEPGFRDLGLWTRGKGLWTRG